MAMRTVSVTGLLASTGAATDHGPRLVSPWQAANLSRASQGRVKCDVVVTDRDRNVT